MFDVIMMVMIVLLVPQLGHQAKVNYVCTHKAIKLYHESHL